MSNRTPTEEQSHILSLAKDTSSNLMLNALAGCIASGTLISIRRGNDLTVRKRPIEALLHIRKLEIPTLVLCDVNGFAEYQPMIGCFHSGIKETVRMETTLGEVIATPDHKIKTERGWVEAGAVTTKDHVFTRTSGAIGRKLGLITIYSVQHHPFAYQHVIGEYGNYKRIHRARLVVEARMNNLSLEEMILIVRHSPYRASSLQYLDPRMEVHHINEDPTDDRFENLEVTSSTEHRLKHKMHLNHTRLGLSQVISVTSAGNRRTYDISMPAPHHNFLANGHVVHNCGKTSTLEMIEQAVDVRPILYLVFNKRNAEEAEERMLSTTTVRTFNSLGHRIWAKACAKNQLRVDPKKSAELLREIIKEVKDRPTQGLIWSVFWEVIHAVGMAKAVGYVPEEKYQNAQRLIDRAGFHSSLEEDPDDFTSDLIDALLIRSIKASYDGWIDYNDQLYMPALFGGTYPRFPLVMVDECQDLSPINHAMLSKLLAKGRLCAVGDRWQNIYGFRGAKAHSIEDLVATYSCQQADLSVSFRCPSEIVKAARWRVPNFKWIKEGGHAEALRSLVVASMPDNATVICRNNAPALRCAFGLLSSGRSVSIAGSDIGPKLIAMMKKLGDGNLSKSTVLGLIDDWEAEKLAKESITASDMAACMRIFANHGNTLDTAISYAEHLFAQKGSIRLLTGHKAKGLEFDTVYFLDPHLCGDGEQDLNLRYVIQTRSKDRLFEIDSRDIRW